MSLFRKQTPVAVPVQPSTPAQSADQTSAPVQAAPQPHASQVFNGAEVDLPALYKLGKLTADELDRVVRAEGLLHLLPSKLSGTREIVDATFRAFSVDRRMIVQAAEKQLDALESSIRTSQEQTQGILDIGAQRIAELEAEIERLGRGSNALEP
jgi:hypothetical protein